MFGADQLSRFAAQVSQARFEIFACKISFRGAMITGVCTGIKTGRKLEEGGFTFSHDGIIRIPISVPLTFNDIGKPMTVFLPNGPACGQQVRIAEFLAHPNNPEWRIGVTAL